MCVRISDLGGGLVGLFVKKGGKEGWMEGNT